MKSLFLLLSLLAALCCWQPQSAQAQTACSAGCTHFNTTFTFSGTTVSTSLTGVTAGNLITALSCFQGPASITSLTIGGTSATLFPATAISNGSGTACQAASLPNSAGGSITATITYPTACSNCFVHIEEWPSSSSTGVLDADNGTHTNGGATSAPSGSFTTTGSHDLVEAFYNCPQTVAITSVPSGFATSVNTATSNGIVTAFETAVAAGAQNPTWTVNASCDNYAIAAGFTAAGSSGHAHSMIGSGL